jgi:hypothetical protein
MEGISEEIHYKLVDLQEVCVECGSNQGVQDHHRRFRGMFVSDNDWKEFMQPFWDKLELYPWGRHDVQELVRLCWKCHDPLKSGTGIHGGNIELRDKYKYSYTNPISGVNIPFDREDFKNKYATPSDIPLGALAKAW